MEHSVWSRRCETFHSVVGGLVSYGLGPKGADRPHDISREHCEVRGYGPSAPWRPEYSRLLHERYGIEFRTVALCVVSTGLLAYVDSCNGVSIAAANRKFGHDVFKECSEEARKNWEHGRKLAKN